MLTVKRFDYSETRLMAEAHRIRTAVFVEEQGIDPSLEYDEYDQTARHYLCLIDGIPAGTGRWRETPQGIKLERYAVEKDYRNHGVGKALLMAMLEDLRSSGKTLYMHAQITAVPFYEKYGFVREGAMFFEAGIGHYRMILQ